MGTGGLCRRRRCQAFRAYRFAFPASQGLAGGHKQPEAVGKRHAVGVRENGGKQKIKIAGGVKAYRVLIVGVRGIYPAENQLVHGAGGSYIKPPQLLGKPVKALPPLGGGNKGAAEGGRTLFRAHGNAQLPAYAQAGRALPGEKGLAPAGNYHNGEFQPLAFMNGKHMYAVAAYAGICGVPAAVFLAKGKKAPQRHSVAGAVFFRHIGKKTEVFRTRSAVVKGGAAGQEAGGIVNFPYHLPQRTAGAHKAQPLKFT